MLSFNWDAPMGCRRGSLSMGSQKNYKQTMQQNSLRNLTDRDALPGSFCVAFCMFCGGISE